MKFNHQKGFIVPLIGGIVALLIAGGIYWAWQMSRITEVTVNNQPIASSTTDFYPNDLNGKLVASSSAQQNYYGGLPANKSSEQTSGPTTSDWKTYSDSLFLIKYPNTWKVLPVTIEQHSVVFNSPSSTAGNVSDFQVECSVSNSTINPDAVIAVYTKNFGNKLSKTTLTIDGINATEISFADDSVPVHG